MGALVGRPKNTLGHPRTEPILNITAHRTISRRIDNYCTSLAQLRTDIDHINFACRFIRSKEFPFVLYFEIDESRSQFLWKLSTQILVRKYSISELVPSMEAKDALVRALVSPESKPAAFLSNKFHVMGVKEFYYFFIMIDDFLPQLFNSSYLALSAKRPRRACEEKKVDEEKYSEIKLDDMTARETSMGDLNTECPICLDKLVSQVLPCGHAYCHGCLETWCLQEHNCPMCRIHVDSSAMQESWQLYHNTIDKGKIDQEYKEHLLSFAYNYVYLFPER